MLKKIFNTNQKVAKKDGQRKAVTYFELNAGEQKKIVKEAVREANKEQFELVKKYGHCR